MNRIWTRNMNLMTMMTENPDLQVILKAIGPVLNLDLINYIISEKDLVLPAEIDYMTLHSGKSINFNLNFSQLSLGIVRSVQKVTALVIFFNRGIEF